MKTKAILKRLPFALIILGICVGSFGYSSVNHIQPLHKATPHDFPKNESGETYGSDLDIGPGEKGPDLIKAEGENGIIGYVRATELEGDEDPKTPEEALALQAKRTEREIPLYGSDGKTVIGKFIIKPVEAGYSKEMRKKEIEKNSVKENESGN